jgi:methylmalonyl-CoA mutase cobalamin-binding domain/chain
VTKDELLRQLYDYTLTGNAPEVLDLTRQGLELGLGPETLLYEALIPSLEEVGARFERGDFFVPEMLIAGKAMAGALEILRPLLAETGAQTIGKIVMGTVKGDVHDIGKNLVNIMFEGAGFEVIDLGVQVAPEKFLAAIQEHQPDIVGFSAFLTTTMPMFKANMNVLEKAGVRDQVIVMVGGAPVTQEYADVVGADGYAADASAAVVRAKELIRRRRAAVAAGLRGGYGNRAVVGDHGAADRRRESVLHHRRADQPDRAQGLPGAAAPRRPGQGRDRRG